MSSAQNCAASVQEYVIRVPKNQNKKYHVMRFNSVLNVEFSKWNQVKMERENNMKEYRGLDDEIPKFGAGSEFGRDQREEARRKKFGIVTKKYRPEDQPWILKVGGKTGKKFKGIREGGVGENAAYYVFTHAPDGAIEAFPLKEWYNFQPIQRYKALSAEEAEQEFGRRNKVMNFFSLMLRKRLRNDEDGDVEELEEGAGGRRGAGRGDLKISEMDDWVDSDADEDGSEEDDADKEDPGKEKKPKKGADAKKGPKKKRRDSNDEAFEESDDGDEEGREVDYISDSSDSELDLEENVKDSMKGVAEEDALRKLLTSDEEDEEEKEGEEEVEDEERKPEEDGEEEEEGGGERKKKKNKSKKGKAKDRKKDVLNDSSSNYSSDSSDSEPKKKNSKGKGTNSGNNSRSATPTKNSDVQPSSSASSSSSTAGNGEGVKRKMDSEGGAGISNKKPRVEGPLMSSALSSDSGITEEAVRRYLMRKPMTTTELLQKFKSKKTGLSSDQLVNVMTQILKRINPIKQTIKGKMYLSIKA